jgi:aspartate 1-decarboxylase
VKETSVKRSFLRAKIHRAEVTKVDLEYVGSLSLDGDLMDAAGLLPYERVEVYNVSNGKRFATYLIKAALGSGEVGVFGAAGHKVKPGDTLIIAAYALLDEEELEFFTPKIVILGGRNAVKEVRS